MSGLSTRIIEAAREGDPDTFLRLAEEYGSVEELVPNSVDFQRRSSVPSRC
jgi:hypothetical protein